MKKKPGKRKHGTWREKKDIPKMWILVGLRENILLASFKIKASGDVNKKSLLTNTFHCRCFITAGVFIYFWSTCHNIFSVLSLSLFQHYISHNWEVEIKCIALEEDSLGKNICGFGCRRLPDRDGSHFEMCRRVFKTRRKNGQHQRFSIRKYIII